MNDRWRLTLAIFLGFRPLGHVEGAASGGPVALPKRGQWLTGFANRYKPIVVRRSVRYRRKLARIFRGSATGQSAVECAVVLPALLMLLFGLLELGRAVWIYEALGSAAREGARYASLHGINSPSPVGPGAASFTAPDRDSTITTIVQSQLAGLDADRLTVLSSWPDGDSVRGSRATVEARYVFESVAASFISMPAFTVSSTATTRVQY